MLEYGVINFIFVTYKKMKKLALTLAMLGLATLTACNNSNANGNDVGNAHDAAPKTDRLEKAQKSTPTLSAGDSKAVLEALSANLTKSGLKLTISDILPTQMPDMYLVVPEGVPPFFTDKTGTYLMQGDIIKLGNNPAIDVSSLAMAGVAKKKLDNVDKSELIIFPAKGKPKSHIYVFTDPTCHYCRILHKDRETLNKAGIEIRYLAWPRGDDLKPLAEAVWCSADRNTALTDAKNDKSPARKTCQNPVQKHMELGASLGVSGTPAVFTADGEQIGGYLQPEAMIQAVLGK